MKIYCSFFNSYISDELVCILLLSFLIVSNVIYELVLLRSIQHKLKLDAVYYPFCSVEMYRISLKDGISHMKTAGEKHMSHISCLSQNSNFKIQYVVNQFRAKIPFLFDFEAVRFSRPLKH